MDPVTIAMLGMGGLNMMQNMQNAERDRTLQAAKMRYSPWTKAQPRDPEVANPVGDLAQAGAGALGYEQQRKLAESNDALRKAQIGVLNRMGSPYSRLRGYDLQEVAPMSGTAAPLSPLGDYNEAGPYAMTRARGMV